jgi:hypothetical protein
MDGQSGFARLRVQWLCPSMNRGQDAGWCLLLSPPITVDPRLKAFPLESLEDGCDPNQSNIIDIAFIFNL